MGPSFPTHETDKVYLMLTGLPLSAYPHTYAEKVPGAELLNNVGAELSYQLPQEQAANFVPLFEALEADMAGWGVQSYGVCCARGSVLRELMCACEVFGSVCALPWRECPKAAKFFEALEADGGGWNVQSRGVCYARGSLLQT